MPEKAINLSAQAVSSRRWSRFIGRAVENQHSGSISRAVKHHAFAFFLVSGGKKEEWGEEAEGHVVREMMNRWRESEWGRILGRHERNRGLGTVGRAKWLGSSFEIGELFGVRLLDSPAPSSRTKSKGSLDSDASQATELASGPPEDTFVTSPLSVASDHVPPSPVVDDCSHEQSATSLSTAGLLRPSLKDPLSSKTNTEAVRRLIPAQITEFRSGVDVSDQQSNKGKGKAKQVRYVDSPSEEHGPAPPQEVLERSGSAVDVTSAGATVLPAENDGDIVMSGT